MSLLGLPATQAMADGALSVPWVVVAGTLKVRLQVSGSVPPRVSPRAVSSLVVVDPVAPVAVGRVLAGPPEPWVTTSSGRLLAASRVLKMALLVPALRMRKLTVPLPATALLARSISTHAPVAGAAALPSGVPGGSGGRHVVPGQGARPNSIQLSGVTARTCCWSLLLSVTHRRSLTSLTGPARPLMVKRT